MSCDETYSPTCSSPTTPSTGCRYRRALLRGFRPSPQTQKVQCGVCPYRCIYCDIWKLATLIYSHVPASLKSSSSSSSSSHSRHSSSSSSPPTSPYLSRSSSSASSNSSSSGSDGGDCSSETTSTKALQAAFQTQRARLASILSICTVDGADACDGLRLAHDRCLISVTDLMNRESSMLQERAAAEAAAVRRREFALQAQPAQRRRSSVRRISRDCAASGSLREQYMGESRRGNYLAEGMAR